MRPPRQPSSGASEAEVGGHMECRPGCGACCVAISISSPLPGMPEGKPAGVRCVNLTDDNRCAIFGTPERPPVCRGYQAEPSFCGATREEAMEILSELEKSCVAPISDARDVLPTDPLGRTPKPQNSLVNRKLPKKL